ncbi:MAG: hypothetical protein ACP5GD_00915 [Candidatus Micrarchaeia archaeon]
MKFNERQPSISQEDAKRLMFALEGIENVLRRLSAGKLSVEEAEENFRIHVAVLDRLPSVLFESASEAVAKMLRQYRLRFTGADFNPLFRILEENAREMSGDEGLAKRLVTAYLAPMSEEERKEEGIVADITNFINELEHMAAYEKVKEGRGFEDKIAESFDRLLARSYKLPLPMAQEVLDSAFAALILAKELLYANNKEMSGLLDKLFGIVIKRHDTLREELGNAARD